MDKMVPYPSGAIVPERDVDKRPVLETHHLGIEAYWCKNSIDTHVLWGTTLHLLSQFHNSIMKIQCTNLS